MKIKKFSAPSSREALKKLREAMGADAIILSTRHVNGLVEVLSLAEEDLDDLNKAAANVDDEVDCVSSRKLKGSEEYSLHNHLQTQRQPQLEKKLTPHKEVSEQQHPSPLPTPEPIKISSVSDKIDKTGTSELMSELRSMRGMMEERLAEIRWGSAQYTEPNKSKLLKEMLASGFGAGLSRYLMENMPQFPDVNQGMTWIKNILSNNLKTISTDNDVLDQGGVFALVGPTGVGKTTTTAKLAARCLMRHGSGKLALISTDGYRIGGYEQLRIYGKILGLMVHTVKDESDLQIALAELKNKHTILIDTVGMSQRDRLVSEQIAMLSGKNINKLLCLNATSTGETLSEVVQSYQGAGLAGCIITKMDEATSIGAVLDVAIRQKLTLFYLANGQRVPEDLHLANKNYLVDHVFKLKHKQSAFAFRDEELPMLMANASFKANANHLREVSLG